VSRQSSHFVFESNEKVDEPHGIKYGALAKQNGCFVCGQDVGIERQASDLVDCAKYCVSNLSTLDHRNRSR
jgi:hypothetical protein